MTRVYVAIVVYCFLALCVTDGRRLRRSSLWDDMVNVLDHIGFGDDGYVDDEPYVQPEAFMAPEELIRYYGYPAETHTVITSDGYVLELHRIPYVSRFNDTKSRGPVLVQHGILSASSTWLINGHTDSLGFVLSDAGYDVWLGNLRGNRFARKNVHLSPDYSDFWQFSLDDHALVDMPAMIDYILGVTDHRALTLIAHSMGATVTILMLSALPEYNQKIKIAALQAPVIYGRYVKNPLRLIAMYPNEIRDLWNLVGSDEILPLTDFSRGLAMSFCNGRPGVIACVAAMLTIGGYNEELLNEERMHVYFAHFPAGTSLNVITHFVQFFRAGKPRRFDYGSYMNEGKYGQATPPDYDISAITAPVAIFWGYMDLYTDKRDLDKLVKQMKNVQLFEMVPFDLWTHQDFQFAKDARLHHYNRLLEVIR